MNVGGFDLDLDDMTVAAVDLARRMSAEHGASETSAPPSVRVRGRSPFLV